MTDELSTTAIDAQLSGLGVATRWRAEVDGFSIIYNTLNDDAPTKLVDSLLRLRAVIDAIEDPNASLLSHEIPLLTAEYERLQRDLSGRVDGSAGGRAGKNKPRNARSYAIAAAFDRLGLEAEIDSILDWLESETCYIVSADGVDTFDVIGYRAVTCERQDTRNAISKLASRKKSK
jgi:hypothetical protein